MGDNCDFLILFSVKLKHSFLLFVIRQNSNFKSLLLLFIVPSFKPILSHHFEALFSSSLLPQLATKTLHLFQNASFILRIAESRNEPSLLVSYFLKIKGRILLHGFFNFRTNVVGRFHDLSERGFNYYGRFWRVVLEDNRASVQSSPHGRHKHNIHLKFTNNFSSLTGLLNSLLSNFHIQILVTEFFS